MLKQSKMIIRNGLEIIFGEPDTDVIAAYSIQHQNLLTVTKVRNKFFIEGIKPSNIFQDIDE